MKSIQKAKTYFIKQKEFNYVYNMNQSNLNQKYKRMFLIQLSACTAETVTYPIDYIKTLIQVNQNRVLFSEIANNILHTKNKLQVYNGLKPALLRHSIYSMLRISFYENLRDTVKTEDNKLNIINKFLIGGLSGGLAQFIASPCDLLKIRYITTLETKKTISISKTIRHIYNENGIRGLWKGVTPNVSRAVLVNFGELATYDQSKQFIKKHLYLEDNTPLHIMSSICSGFVASVCCTPADVIKSRIMQTNNPYNGITDCIIQTINKEGVITLYKGFFPIWFRLAPWQLIFWVSYEKLRILSGLESF